MQICEYFCLDILENHIQKQHAEIKNLRKYHCSKCNYKCYDLTNLKNHNQLLHGKKNLKCHHCPGKNFKSKLSIQTHVTNLHIKRTCRHCKRKYFAGKLKRHLQQLNCQFCNSSFPCVLEHAKHVKKCKYFRNGWKVTLADLRDVEIYCCKIIVYTLFLSKQLNNNPYLYQLMPAFTRTPLRFIRTKNI